MEHLRLDLAAGPWWLYALIVIAAAVFSTYIYSRTNPPIDSRSRWILTALRTIGLICLVLMLFEPLLRFIRSEERRPRVAIALDVSRSMTVRDGGADRASAAKDAASRIASALGEDADVLIFDESVRNAAASSFDTVRFSGFRTDLAAVVRRVANDNARGSYGAVVLVTDGNHNTDESPVFIADRSGMGVYAVGVGDTVPPVDLSISGLLVNGIAVVNEPLPITVDVSQTNVPDGEAVLTLADNGVVFATERIVVRRGLSKIGLTVLWTPSSDGIRKLTARVAPVRGEFTEKNNVMSEFVQVRRNKRRVVIIAGAPSPDLTFVRGALQRDPSVTVQTYVQKQGGDFYEGALAPTAFDDVEAIALVGFPTATTPKAVLDRVITAAGKGRSILFIASQQTEYARLGGLEAVLPFRVKGSRPQEFMVTPNVTRGATADPLLKIAGTEADRDRWNALPPLYRTETFVDPQPGAVVLATLKVGTAELDEPLIMKRENGQARSVAVLGYGLYRWKLLSEGPAVARGASVSDVLGTFLGNTLTWLSVRDDDRRVRIRPTHPFYASGERVVLQASVQDEMFAPVDAAEVRVSLTGPTGKRDVVLSGQGSGRYSFDLGPLPPGDYAFNGTAKLQGITVGSDGGRFTVGELGLEEGASTQNRSLLRTLTTRTGGYLADPNNVEALISAIRNDPRLRPTVRTSERETPLHHMPWLIAVATLAFAFEWFLRKRRGLA